MINLKNRTVAFLDVLGFKEILKKYRPEVIGKVYKHAITSAIKVANNWSAVFSNKYLTKCSIFFFSDSIAIFSPDFDGINDDLDKSGFLTVVLYAQRIMQGLIAFQFPVRGAIAFGETYLNKRPAIFLGDGYKKAVDLEKKQEWIGICIDESIEQKFPNFFTPENLIMQVKGLNDKKMEVYSHPTIIRYPVPLKSGDTEPRYTINWLEKFTCYDGEKKKIENTDLIDTIKKSLKNTDDFTAEEKYKNTCEYVEYINSIYLQDEDGSSRHFVASDKYTKITDDQPLTAY